MEIIKALGIDNYQVLIAQFLTFAILLYILYKLAYDPIIKMLDERTAKIDKGIKDAETAVEKLQEIEKQEKEVLNKAKREAQEIITSAEEVAEKNKAEILENTRTEARKVFADTEKAIEEEKKKMREELKKETIELVMVATEKVLKDKIDGDKDKEIIESAVKRSL